MNDPSATTPAQITFAAEWGPGGWTPHAVPFLLSMSMCNGYTSGSFFITTAPVPDCDKRHVVFGRVVKGEEVVLQVNRVGYPTNGTSTATITIADCGEIKSKSL